ncbi:22417_t:CDS:2, partial [Racocetra persica]
VMSNLTINPNNSLMNNNNGVINELDNSLDENENSLNSLDNLINISKKALAILEQQKSFVVDVEEYQRRRTMPLTWKDYN